MAKVAIAHGSDTLLACAIAGSNKRTPWVYRNIGDPAVWGDVRGARLRVGVPLRRAAAVGALYESARWTLVERYRLDPGRVVTIPNAVSEFPEPTEADRTAARVTLDLDAGLTWLAFVGALSEEKDVCQAVRVVAADPQLGLVVAGDGTQRAEAEALAARIAPGRVRFLGVSDQPLTVMAAVAALIIPSRTEGMPAVAIEAGLSGIPVVATRVGGLPEIVLDRQTGVLVDGPPEPRRLLDAVHRAVEGRSLLGSAARQHCAAHFTMGPVAAKWAELLDRLER